LTHIDWSSFALGWGVAWMILPIVFAAAHRAVRP
jgi:hypothetical protein